MLSIVSAVLTAAVALTPVLSPEVGRVEQPRPEQQQAQAQRKPVDVNTATAEQLQAVPGIGEALAKRIIEFRTEHGPFEKIDDLLNVRGIGVASLEKLRPFLTIKKSG